ncbi:MAG: iron complex outermembrane receptor protein [Paracoccaceae bacterium]
MSNVHARKVLLRSCVALAISSSLHSLAASSPNENVGDLAELSLESLMGINVYSVSKTAEPWLSSAAAIYVLSGAEIRRSGVKTMPEALRLVPGVTVARVDAHSWAVTSRGFNGTLVDKLEVLMDGRSLYTPLFSGVYWQRHNISMSNIDRIEVIRGPGASMWGANAVNGVINIVTSSAADADSFRAETGASNGQRNHTSFSSAIKGEKAALKIYGREENYANFRLRDGSNARDGFESQRLGFRSDIDMGRGESTLTLQGERYKDRVEQPGNSREETNEINFVLANWVVDQADGAGFELSAYVEDSLFNIPSLFKEDRTTFEIEAVKHFKVGERHELVLGMSYNKTSDQIESPDQNIIGFLPAKRSDETFDASIQDQIELVKDRLRLTVGLKAEKNDYSGTEIQPTLRMAFTPTRNSTLWAALSRAVRIPTRLDQDIIIFAPAPFPSGTVLIKGSKDFEPERLIAMEFGIRHRYSDDLTLDLALYRNEYDQLRGTNANVFPLEISNEGEGDTSGAEVFVQWDYSEQWVHRASYTYQHTDYHAKRGSSDTSINPANRNDPRHQAMLRSTWLPNDTLSFEARVRNVSELPDLDVDGYTELDISISWQANENLQLTVMGQNLLDRAHAEFSSPSREVEVHRSLLFGLEWVY